MWTRDEGAPRFQLEGPSGMGRVMDAMQFLRSVDDEERRAYKGMLYTVHAEKGPTMGAILQMFASPDEQNFDPERILRTCKEWSRRVNLSPVLYDRVVAAVQVILNGETYQTYVETTQRARCSDLRRMMAVQVALLQKVTREAQELARLTRYLLRTSGTGLPDGGQQLLVLTQNGGIFDVVRRGGSREALLAHVNAKQQMLDSARRSALMELSRLWNKFRQCPRSARRPGPGNASGTKVSFVPVQQFEGKEAIYAEALTAASEFQRVHGVQTDGGGGRVLLFNDLAGVTPYAGLRGGTASESKKSWIPISRDSDEDRGAR